MQIKANYERFQNVNNPSTREGWVWQMGTFFFYLYEWKERYIYQSLKCFFRSFSLSNYFIGNSVQKIIMQCNQRVIFKIYIWQS